MQSSRMTALRVAQTPRARSPKATKSREDATRGGEVGASSATSQIPRGGEINQDEDTENRSDFEGDPADESEENDTTMTNKQRFGKQEDPHRCTF